jgi:amino acid transporter
MSVEEEYSYMPSRSQQVAISAAQLSTSLLSLVGSSLIIHNVRRIKKKTPYRRILLALSACDIISTIGWLMQPFLTPRNAPDPWVWAIGNDATCVMLGALSQFGFSAHWYSGMLSFYFLLKVKFGMREKTFELKYERWIHASIILFSISTAIAGIFLGVFRPMIVAPGCWVSAPPEGCSEQCPEERLLGFLEVSLPY